MAAHSKARWQQRSMHVALGVAREAVTAELRLRVSTWLRWPARGESVRSLAHGSQILCAEGQVKLKLQFVEKPLQGTAFLARGPLHAAFGLLLHRLQSHPTEAQQPALTAELLVDSEPQASLR